MFDGLKIIQILNKDKTKKEYYVGGQNTYKTKEAFIGALKDVRYIPLL